MKTDKQLYTIFEANPDWIFQLADWPSPGKSSLHSVTIKELERRADCVIIPDSAAPPLTVVEFQFWKDETIYTRTVAEMIAVQESHQMRPVQGIIFFGYDNLDPKTAPWTRVVGAFILRDVVEVLERGHPGHPLAAVFKPLLVESEEALERDAVGYYRTIKDSDLPTICKASLLDVFVSWLEQRLTRKGKKEIEMMLLGELPELEETQSGKDLIRIGEQRGLEKAILVSLKSRYGTVPVALQETIHTLTTDEAECLLEYLIRCQTLDELAEWLASRQP
ncbi:MAG: DUF2887 domain-containing protein [Planctomycetota bacterium]|nr:DUF2887 domain-containing protein [Planctomycetota bacterium]